MAQSIRAESQVYNVRGKGTVFQDSLLSQEASFRLEREEKQ